MKSETFDKEKTIIVGVELYNESDIEDSMDELEDLVIAAGGVVLYRTIQKRSSIDPAYFIGKGKALEIKEYCDLYDIDTVVFNDELSGAQIRNLEDIIDRKIVDRTTLILDIFASRANSKEGKLQVKLAQLKYRLPRLTGFRNYLSRTGGGIGTRGPGEQKLELDRRHLLKEINNIEKELKEVEKTRNVKRKKRANSAIPMVALVGYTNSGKSTLLNRILELYSNSDETKKVFAYDMLFATLETSLRQVRFPNGQKFIITDTVGFVSKLPTNLIEAFKGTLEEVKYADLILHVVDASSKNLNIQIETTMNILKELEVLNKPIITVFNKMDKSKIDELIYDTRYVDKKIFISGKYDENLDGLLNMIMENLKVEYKEATLLIPYQKQDIVSFLLDNYEPKMLKYDIDGVRLTANIEMQDYERFKAYEI